MADKPLFLYVGDYSSEADAKADADAIRDLYRDKVIGSYDIATVTKDHEGKVHVKKHEKPTQHGAEIGAVAGAVVGLLFPPFLLADIAIGAAAGGLIGHFRKGMSHKDLKELGETLQDSETALIVVGEDRIEEQLEKQEKRAVRTIEKQITADAKALNREIEAAMKD